ncbi:hypothetical protein NDU88_004013 [Pleurodeles waltl]|uniref:Uncharacterized protein n=1 Tax=Pleurodeles waltl TaxID=8319 RepID=A0AAV7NIL1_PLEWA|nr:hypothetical protein NDU88_004013 [Pleurodeles waltl]
MYFPSLYFKRKIKASRWKRSAPHPGADEHIRGHAINVSRSDRQTARARSTYLCDSRRSEQHLPLRLRSRI